MQVRLESKLQEEELRSKEALTTTESQKTDLQLQFVEDITAYKVITFFTCVSCICRIINSVYCNSQEQSEQYALTIVALEAKLLELMDKCKTLNNENLELVEKLKVETMTGHEKIEGVTTYTHCANQHSHNLYTILTGSAETVQKLNLVVCALRCVAIL